MPIIAVKLSATPSAETTQRAAALVLEHTQRILKKNPALTAITVEYVDPRHWVVGGRTLAAQGRHSFFVDVKVVDETNTKAEKAQYIAELFEAFGTLLAPLHPESYIHVNDVRAAAYGFGGRTQEWRYQHPA